MESDPSSLLTLARSGDRAAFDALVVPYRREIQLHCYRLLGGLHDAEDAVQETLLRAWRGVGKFEGRASFRRWLYRIATNVCLSHSARRRVMPETEAPPSTQMPPREPALEEPWLEPYPDAWIAEIPDSAPGPDARYELGESVRLAFVALIQLLPPRQRAVLVLRDVLGWSSEEAARVLDGSVASVNSALQRARATIEKRVDHRTVTPDEHQHTLLDRYMRSWENADVEEFVSVLRDDAMMSMPPWREWYRGRDALRTFFAFTAQPGGHAPFRLVRTAGNGQVAFAFYSRWRSPEWRAHSIQLLELEDDGVRVMTSFVMPGLFPAFDLPNVLE